MAGNTGNGYRKGAVKGKSQTYNPKTKQHVKRDTTSGKFVSSKKTPYKGVKKEPTVKQNMN
jgi:hypothetical protein